MQTQPRTNLNLRKAAFSALACLAASLIAAGCGKSSPGGSGASAGGKVTLQNKGSDTLVNVAQSWAEEYKKLAPQVNVEVAGGGSGQGIAALIGGTVHLASSSRNMKPTEIEDAKKNTGKTPKEFVVGHDALAIYVHKDSPLTEISFEQLAAMFAENGTATKWSQFGTKIPGCDSDEIVRVGRQSSSGTYDFFREHVLANNDFKQGTREMNGSKEVVELIGNTPCAIGYSGMGYATDKVKMLKVTAKAGQPAMEPSVANTLSHAYPISRSLLVYTLGEPEGELKKYVDWILSDPGQRLVEQGGYVPLSAAERVKKSP